MVEAPRRSEQAQWRATWTQSAAADDARPADVTDAAERTLTPHSWLPRAVCLRDECDFALSCGAAAAVAVRASPDPIRAPFE